MAVNAQEIQSAMLVQRFRDTLLAMFLAETAEDAKRLSREADQIEQEINRRIAW